MSLVSPLTLLDRVRGVDVKRKADKAIDRLDEVSRIVARINIAADRIGMREGYGNE